MFRAEKASSKLCRDREVEKAQEIHRRKIDGVKSYLTEITRPPAPSVPASNKSSRPSTFFRRSLRQHASALKTPHAGDQKSSQPKSAPADDYGDDFSDEEGNNSGDGDGNGKESASTDRDEVECKSFGKLDELRSVLVPVMAYKDQKSESSDLDYERFLDAITNPAPPVQEPPKITHRLRQTTHSLRAGAFRMRRLKQIEADNTTIFERIKNSSPHYRAETFKKEWDQNVAYLTSICEFPVVDEVTHTALSPRRATYSAARKRSPFPSRPPDQLPSLQLESTPVFHPIKVFPTSPKKVNPLNLSPAFRSLRKGLPQVPALPPLTVSPRVAHTSKSKSVTALASPRAVFALDGAAPHDTASSPPVVPRRSPSQPKSTHSAYRDAIVADDPSRYTLLKIGRFVGGKYLVLTVFCGDGIANPYGFDVVALDPEAQIEFNLSITKETTHLLLETVSSSSMAERTAAAAGTNLSMELIARCLCNHIGYARTANSEVVFLVATVGNPGGLSGDTSGGESDADQTYHSSQVSASERASLLVDTSYAAMAFCFYQHVRIPTSTDNAEHDGSGYLHVFASTRPQQCCRASMQDALTTPLHSETRASSSGEGYNGLLCFEVRDDCGAERSRPFTAQLQISFRELVHRFESEQVAVDSSAPERLSLDRFIMLSLQYLHLERLSSIAKAEWILVLTLSGPNNWACPGSPRRPSSSVRPSSLESQRHQHPRHACSQQVLMEPSYSTLKLSAGVSPHDELKTVVETGILWRGVYLVARVALLSPGRLDHVSGRIVREPHDELLVINILNTTTGNFSERTLDGDQVEEFSQKMGAWQLTAGTTPPLIVFTKQLLLRMRLDVDLRGHEIVYFPTLEPRYHNAGGGRSSPVASSRRGSPKKHSTSTADEAPAKDDRTSLTLVESNSQDLTQAAATIQALARRFLRRRRRSQDTFRETVGISLSDCVFNWLPQEDSLSALVLAFMKNRAAKRIQFASRKYADRGHRRRAQFEMNGLSITAPRSLTPVATRKSRSMSGILEQAENNGVGTDTPAITDNRESDDSEDEDDDTSRSKHVDTLGVLEEDEQEEAENEDEDPQGENDSIPVNADSPDKKDEDASGRRRGKKVHDQFVLERGADRIRGTSAAPSTVLEYRIIGALGQLEIECE
jgi:hypothetical protein